MNIYFHIDEISRDAITASAFSKAVKSKGWKVIFGNRDLGRLLPVFEKYFDVIVLPKPTFLMSIFGNSHILNLKSNYVILYTEQIGIMTSKEFPELALRQMLDKEFMSGDTKFVNKVSAFCFWSNQAYKIVVSKFPELQSKCHVVGHPRHDLIANPIVNRNNNERNMKIGILTRAVLLNDYFGRNPLENIFVNSKNIERGGILEFNNNATGESFISQIRGTNPKNDIFLEAIDFENMLFALQQLLICGFKISFKLHPKEDPQLYLKLFRSYNENISIAPKNLPFANWAQHQKYVIGPPSTSFYDAYLVGTLPISTSHLSDQRQDFVSSMYEDKNQLMSQVFKPTNLQELLNFVCNTTDTEYQSLIRAPKIVEILREEVNYPYQTESISYITKIIEELEIERSKCIKKKVGVTIFRIYANVTSEVKHLYLSLKAKTSGQNYLNSANFMMNSLNRRMIRKLCNNLK